MSKQQRLASVPKFDKHQFAGRRTRAVSTESGITFPDYSRMHVQRREVTPERRLPTPQWAMRDEWLRELLVVYLEERFYIRKGKGTLRDRLDKIRVASDTVRPRKFAQLKKFVNDLNLLKQNGTKEKTDEQVMHDYSHHSSHISGNWAEQPLLGAVQARAWIESYNLRMLEIQILNLDTDLVLTAKDGGAAAVVAAVYLYYRNGWDSVAVAEELGFKPPHIRQLMWRLNETWKDKLKARFEPNTPATSIEDGSKDARPPHSDAENSPPDEANQAAEANVTTGDVKDVPGIRPQLTFFNGER